MRSMGLIYMKHEQNKFQCKSFLNHSYINCRVQFDVTIHARVDL